VLIRFPKAEAPSLPELHQSVEPGRGVFLRRNFEDVLLIGVGGLCIEALESVALLRDRGIGVDVYALRCIKPLDSMHLASIASEYRRVFVVEEGVVAGGAGEAVAAAVRSEGADVSVISIGISGMFNARGNRRELLSGCGIDAPGIAGRVGELLGVEGRHR
jgi:1-deoxy-D-xylulose-5-phosphate synthase